MGTCNKGKRRMRSVFALFCLVCAILPWSPHRLRAEVPPQAVDSPPPREAAGAPLQPPAGVPPQETAAPPSQGAPDQGPTLFDPGSALPDRPQRPPETGPNSAAGREVLEALKGESFTYTPGRLTDPFISFMAPAKAPVVQVSLPPIGPDEGEEPPPEPPRPLTPLQKMSIGEIERGLKAILWGDMGRRAVIEDSAGKGYIVTIGTPIGGNNGVIADIFDDHLIIQQEVWDRKLKQMVPHNISVQILKKEKG